MRQLSLGVLSVFFVAACSSAGDGGSGGSGASGGSGGGANGGNSGSGGTTEPAPYNSVAWDIEDVELHAGFPAGLQGKLLVGSDGTLYYAYFKFHSSEPTCDIAVFGGGTAPGVN